MSRFAGINQSEVDNGAIAQLGERLPCTQEVGGSIPPGSTTIPPLLSSFQIITGAKATEHLDAAPVLVCIQRVDLR